MTISEILQLRGVDLRPRSIKMVRHQHPPYDLSELQRRGQFDTYQWNQGKHCFDCELVVSFLGGLGRHAKLVGVYRILEHEGPVGRPWPREYLYPEMPRGRHFYKVARLEQFGDLENRLVIDWGAGVRAWCQWLKPREIIEILPRGYIGHFPAFLDFSLSFSQLQELVNTPEANRVWHQHLASVGGVYLVLDTRTGRQYVGSASGRDGILGRWTAYAATGHGGNSRLRALLSGNPAYAHNLRYTVLRTLPKSLTRKEVLAFETMYKDKLGSKAFGLNVN